MRLATDSPPVSIASTRAACMLVARRPRATITSNSAAACTESIASSARMPIKADSARRMRSSSRVTSAAVSRQVLPSSTTPMGSMNTVAPVFDTSWTMPGTAFR